MENASIHRWTVLVFILVYVLTVGIRWVRVRTPLTYHIGPALLGAGGTTAITESVYLLYYYYQHDTVLGIQGLTVYAIAGALAFVMVGAAGIAQGFKE
jgi:hypothetical protein